MNYLIEKWEKMYAQLNHSKKMISELSDNII